MRRYLVWTRTMSPIASRLLPYWTDPHVNELSLYGVYTSLLLHFRADIKINLDNHPQMIPMLFCWIFLVYLVGCATSNNQDVNDDPCLSHFPFLLQSFHAGDGHSLCRQKSAYRPVPVHKYVHCRNLSLSFIQPNWCRHRILGNRVQRGCPFLSSRLSSLIVFFYLPKSYSAVRTNHRNCP